MNSIKLGLVVSLVLSLASVACSTGGPDEPTTGSGTGAGTGNPPGASTAAGSPSASSTPKSGASSLGPECTKYIDCCESVATANAQLGASCDSTKTAIENAQKQGVSVASYESACTQGVSGFRTAGYCK